MSAEQLKQFDSVLSQDAYRSVGESTRAAGRVYHKSENDLQALVAPNAFNKGIAQGGYHGAEAGTLFQPGFGLNSGGLGLKQQTLA